MAIPTSVLVTSAGSSPIAVLQQTQGGNTVYVQQAALVDPTSGTPSSINAAGNLAVQLQVGTPNTSGVISAAAIASGATVTMTSTVVVTSGYTGTLQHGVFAATQPMLWTIQTVNNAGAATTVCSFMTNAYETYDFRPGWPEEVATAVSTGAAKFQVTAQNLSANTGTGGNADAYATFFWAEN